MSSSTKGDALSIAAAGFAIMLVFLGVGGCAYLCGKGDAARTAAEHSNP